ncbi:MAG: penicillin-binding protein 2 [Nitrospinota bacterium]
MVKDNSSGNVVRQRKIILSGGFFVVIFLVIAWRLFQVHIVWHDKLLKFSAPQYSKTIYKRPDRGTIFDREGREMAVTIEAESLFVRPFMVENVDLTASKLSKALGISKEKIKRDLSGDKRFVWIDRQISPEVANKVRKLNLKGVDFLNEGRRYYPSRELGARSIGFVGIDNQGLAGIEYYYDSYIRSAPKKIRTDLDLFNNLFEGEEQDGGNELKGIDLVLTMDKVIQHFAEHELRKQVKATNAVGGVVIVMDPMTGEVLAMADQPQFNPNEYDSYDKRLWSNKAVSHTFEPGSTFKVLLAAASIDSGLMKPTDTVYCENGEYRVGGLNIHEAHNKKYQDLTIKDVLAKSSNIGAVKIGEILESDQFYNYMQRFGIGSKTGIDLPAESNGLFRSIDRWTSSSLPAMSFGQELSVTPMQLITAVSAVANGGLLLKPRVVKGLSKEGHMVKTFNTEVVRRAISQDTSRIMTDLLENVVREGTGSRAAISGFRVAGKTGTSQKSKVDGGGYSSDKFIATFVGYFPAEAPRIAILVMIDEPQKEFYGGVVAAPVFKNIAERTAGYLNMVPDDNSLYYVYGDNDKLVELSVPPLNKKKL